MDKTIPFERSFASCKNVELWSSNNILKPIEIALKSNKEALFICRNCKHEFKSVISNMSREGNGCPYCASRTLCDNLDCKECFEKSFASHSNVKYWSKQNIDSQGILINPRFVFKNSYSSYFFDCHKCLHTFQKIPQTFRHTNGCHYCSNDKLCKDNDCKICFKKSFASHEKSIYWSSSNKLITRQVYLNDNKKYLFDCIKCKHTFPIGLNHVVEGKWCHYCSHHKLCEKDDCEYCFDNSFASHPKSEHWSTKNKLKPREVFRTSHKKYIFKCNFCDVDFTKETSRIFNGEWCAKCKNKTEKTLFEELKKYYESIEHQFYTSWCRNLDTNWFLPFDFVLHDYKIIIELDGNQHFEQVMNWATPESQLKRDIYKMKCANKNGYSVIRISQQDVYLDRIEWLSILKETIDEIKEKNIIENYFISFDENLYIQYIFSQ